MKALVIEYDENTFDLILENGFYCQIDSFPGDDQELRLYRNKLDRKLGRYDDIGKTLSEDDNSRTYEKLFSSKDSIVSIINYALNWFMPELNPDRDFLVSKISHSNMNKKINLLVFGEE